MIVYDIYYKSPEDGFKEIHFHARVAYRGTAVFVCDKLKAEGKKPWFLYVKIN